MITVDFKSEKTLKDQLSFLAKMKGISLSALIKLYLNQSLCADVETLKK